MAITEEKVHQVADELDREGINPTLQALRERLGGGSFSTLSAYKKSWTEKRKASVRTPIEPTPPEVAEKGEKAAEAIWQLALEHAKARHQLDVEHWQEELRSKDEEISQLQEAADDMARTAERRQADAEGLKIELAEVRDEQDRLRESNAELSRSVEDAGRDLVAAEKRYESDVDRLTRELHDERSERRNLEQRLSKAEAAQEQAIAAKQEQAQRLTAIESELATARQNLQEATSQLSQARQEAEHWEHEAERLKALEAEVPSLTAKLESAKEREREWRAAAEKAQGEAQAAANRAAKAEGALEALKGTEKSKGRAARSSGTKSTTSSGAKGKAKEDAQ